MTVGTTSVRQIDNVGDGRSKDISTYFQSQTVRSVDKNVRLQIQMRFERKKCLEEKKKKKERKKMDSFGSTGV